LQNPKGRDVEDGDEFEFNDEFAAPLYRIKVRWFFSWSLHLKYPRIL